MASVYETLVHGEWGSNTRVEFKEYNQSDAQTERSDKEGEEEEAGIVAAMMGDDDAQPLDRSGMLESVPSGARVSTQVRSLKQFVSEKLGAAVGTRYTMIRTSEEHVTVANGQESETESDVMLTRAFSKEAFEWAQGTWGEWERLRLSARQWR